MIEARQFVDAARGQGFDFWAGVPCSFLTPFINYTIGDEGLTYISSANEGDAVAAASGATLGGHRSVAMMQNSGLGNAVSPLTSLNYVFQIPILLIITLRGEPGSGDEPQHELMGQVTQQLLDSIGIPWDWFPDYPENVMSVLHKAIAHMDLTGRPYALIMKKGMVAPFPLSQSFVMDKPPAKTHSAAEGGDIPTPHRHDVLKQLVGRTETAETVLIASTGFSGRELFAIEDRPNHLYMVGSMGCASSLGLGLSIVRPNKKIVVIDGDGAALMRLGNMATVGAYGGNNYHHLLLDNHVHESTGGQATVSPFIDFPAIASACGYRTVFHPDASWHSMGHFLQASGPAFMRIETTQGVPEGLGRPSIKPVNVARRLMTHLGVDSAWM